MDGACQPPRLRFGAVRGGARSNARAEAAASVAPWPGGPYARAGHDASPGCTWGRGRSSCGALPSRRLSQPGPSGCAVSPSVRRGGRRRTGPSASPDGRTRGRHPRRPEGRRASHLAWPRSGRARRPSLASRRRPRPRRPRGGRGGCYGPRPLRRRPSSPYAGARSSTAAYSRWVAAWPLPAGGRACPGGWGPDPSGPAPLPASIFRAALGSLGPRDGPVRGRARCFFSGRHSRSLRGLGSRACRSCGARHPDTRPHG